MKRRFANCRFKRNKISKFPALAPPKGNAKFSVSLDVPVGIVVVDDVAVAVDVAVVVGLLHQLILINHNQSEVNHTHTLIPFISNTRRNLPC